jgi:4-amino-4-deoxy-L-arabinose transferase-like glycosyltransferase
LHALCHSRRSGAELIGLAVLLVATAVGYLWDLSASGYANSFYAAAVEAGTKSWKAFFFGSLDASNFITVDKPPASLWAMEISGRIFGFSSLSMLLPEALMGVATVALVYSAVRRWHGPAPALVAGSVMAATPVAALMFRFNNPDAMLVLLMTAGAYCLARALEQANTKWFIACGAVVGFAFLAKMGEAFLVVPGFGIAYLVTAPAPLRRRVVQCIAAGAAAVASAGWWVLAVAVWPVGSRPMIDGSPTNSILNLIFAYNGLDRVTGSSGGGPGGGGGFSGATGALRLFNALMGAQASWLLPAAFIALATGLVLTVRAPRTDRTRAALIMWGGWLVVTAAVFSYSQGIIHTYYAVALAPPIAALVGTGVHVLWKARRAIWARSVTAATVVATAWWAVRLLDRSPTWEPWLRPAVIVAACACVAALGVSTAGRSRLGSRWQRAAGTVALGAAGAACIAGPLAFSVQTVATAHTGPVPSAGPATSGALTAFQGRSGTGPGAQGRTGEGARPRGDFGGLDGQFPGPGGPGGTGLGYGPGVGPGGAPGAGARNGRAPGGTGPGGFTPGTIGGTWPGGRAGAQGTTVARALAKALELDASRYRWVAATEGSQAAASIELGTGGEPVMGIGGFDNEGGNLSLATFERYVKAGDIHYFIAGGDGTAGMPGGAGRPGRGGSTSSIATWVESHFTARTIGGEEVHDLAPSSS